MGFPFHIQPARSFFQGLPRTVPLENKTDSGALHKKFLNGYFLAQKKAGHFGRQGWARVNEPAP
jgi:hypothetical protein